MNSNSVNKDNRTALEQAVNRALQLIQLEQISSAESLLRQQLLEHPDNETILHLLGMCQRKTGQLDGAMELQNRILQKNPDFAAAYQELGLCLRLKGQRREAMEAFRLATEKDPRMVNSWKIMGDIACVLGEQDTAVHAYAQYPNDSADDPMLVRALELIEGKQYGPADFVIRMYLKRFPGDARALYNQSRIAVGVGALTEALELLEQALEHAPGDQQARLDYTNLLSRRQRYDEALAQVKLLRKADPANTDYRLLHAALLERSGQYEPALRLLNEVLKEDASQARVWVRAATLQRILGQSAKAVTSLHKAIDCDHDLGEPWYLLADMKTVPFTDGQIEALKGSVERAPKQSDDEIHFSFALARALESRGRVEEAWRYYQRANASRNARATYDGQQQDRYFAALKDATLPDVFEDLPGAGQPDTSPIFIVGLPRSGSTLVEQIITQHSQVQGVMELPHLSTLIKELNFRQQKKNRSVYPAALPEIDADECGRIGQDYLDRTRILRGSEPHFVDKMPNNFEHIGLIHLALPNARIIDVRRNPLANGFSAYRQLFAGGQEWSYDLAHIAAYYRAYIDLMNHWDTVLPGKVYRLNYEDLVSRTEAVTRELLDHLGLAFEAACLSPEKNTRAIRTASSEQVRQAIYPDALDHWKHFEPQLEPLRQALGTYAD